MAVKWVDEYSYSDNRILLTEKELSIPGVRMFGMQNNQKASLPLCDHYHENAFEIVFSAHGNVTFYTNGKEYRLNGGTAFFVHPNEIHSTHETPLSPGKFYWFQLESNVPNLLFLEKDASETLTRQLMAISHHNIRTDNKEINSIITQAFALAMQPGHEMMVAAYLQIFLHLLVQFASASQQPMTPDISRALIYIYDHITSEITLEELADLCALSLSRFKQKFRDQMGVSPRNYINQQKIEYAKSLLKEGGSITDVSMALGFSTSSYFSYIFKKHTMLTPTEFIQNRQLDYSKT